MSNIELMRFEIDPPFFTSYPERYFEILMDEFVSDYQSIGPNREIIELKVSVIFAIFENSKFLFSQFCGLLG